jgi:actin-related protein 10
MAAAPTTPTATRVVSTSASNQVPSPHYATTRRHSLYGTEDRIVIDPGSRVWKVGFSGEGRPRDVFVTASPKYGSSLWSFSFGKTAAEQTDALILLEQRLQDLLRSVFFECVLHDYLPNVSSEDAASGRF